MTAASTAAEPTRTDRLLTEFAHEAATTRRVLERVPEDRFSWRPHPKSMSLGQLAQHIAALPGAIAEIANVPAWEARPVPRPEAETSAGLLDTLENSVSTLNARLREWDDAGLDAEWRMTADGRTLLALQRGEVVRSIILNHWYHHRGQLTVYLRLLDVPLPAVYGDSADERPLG